MTTIYNKQGTAIVTIPTSGTKRRALMGENNIKLEFEHSHYFDFALGCYIVYEYERDPLLIERFDIITTSIPEICKDGYKYSLTFEAAECQLKRFNIFYDEGESSEVAFCLYDDINTFGGLIAKCANKYISTITWSYGGCNLNIEGVKSISFKGDKLYETLNMVAEAFGCEWWTETNCGYDSITGKLKTDVHIWFGKLGVGSEVDFEVNKVVSSMQRQGGDSANYGTRFFCFGSTKNLTSDYGQSAVKSGVSEIRLHLPDGIPYIDTKEGLTNEEIIHQTVFFDEIYPKNTDIVTKVETEPRKVEGDETQKTFDAYIVTAANTPFVPSDVIEGQTLMIEFTSGQLWGQEFEVKIKYDPKTWEEKDGFDKRFEINAIQEQGDGEIFFIPNAAIKPVETDTFILKNVKLAKARINEAEAELLSEGRKWAIKNSADTDVYNCPMNPVYCTPKDLSFDLGQKVRLVDKRFPSGSRSSRIMSYEKRLENKYVGSYTVGDNTTYSHLGKMESDIKASQYTERVGVDAGGTHIITKYDNTMPSDSNLYSALKTMLTFAKLVGGNLFRGIQQFYDGLRSSDFVTGLTGKGFQIKKDEQGKWREEIDSLTVREFLEVPELRFNRVDVASGDSWNAIAFGTIESVDTENQIVTVKLLDGELLTSHVNDICRGVFYNLGDGTGKDTDANGFDQMQGFGTAYFTPVELLPDGKSFRYSLQSGTTIHPCKAMKYVSYGNFTDKSRQASKYSTKTYTRYLRNVNTWNIIPDKHIVAQFGDIEGLTIGGVTMHGNGSFLNNIYMTGTNIQFTPEQLEDMRGHDAYSVCLSSPNVTIKKGSDGVIVYQEEMNVVSGDSSIVSGDSDVVASSHLLRTQIQALKGAKPMFYSDVIQPYAYTIETYPVNCECSIDGGVLLVTSITDLSKESAYVDMDINCEGNAVISLRYSITIVEDGVDGKDGKDHEFIFTRTTSNTLPDTPETSQVNDYVPDGWTDDAVGVTSTYQYEWSCKRSKVDGVWGDYSTPALWSKYSFDGDDGDPAVSYNFISPVTSIRKNSLGFFEPSSFEVTLKKSVGGAVMNSGDKYITVFGSESGSSWDRITNSVWSYSVTVTPQSRYNMYCVKATDGYNPSFGDTSYAMIGINVVDGQMAGSFPRNCGEYKPNYENGYVYNSDFRDCVWVKDGATTRVFMVRTFGDTIKGVDPLNDTSDPSRWVVGNVEQFTAINTALIDGADIAGFLFKDGVMQSRDTNSDGKPNLLLNGETGYIEAYNGKFNGEINAFSGTFRGSIKTDFQDIRDVTEYDEAMNAYFIKDVLNLSTSLYPDRFENVVLPSDIKYAGSIINIVNTNYAPYSKSLSTSDHTIIEAHPESICRGIGIGGSCDNYINEKFEDPYCFRIRGSLMQLLGVPRNGITYWIILNHKNSMQALETTRTHSIERRYLDIGRPLTCQKVNGKNSGWVIQEAQPQIRDKIIVSISHAVAYTWYSDWQNNGDITQVAIRYDTTTCPL